MYFCTLRMFRDKTRDCELNLVAGTLAQSVEQRTENPCVPGSIPGGTTFNNKDLSYTLKGLFICPKSTLKASI